MVFAAGRYPEKLCEGRVELVHRQEQITRLILVNAETQMELIHRLQLR